MKEKEKEGMVESVTFDSHVVVDVVGWSSVRLGFFRTSSRLRFE